MDGAYRADVEVRCGGVKTSQVEAEVPHSGAVWGMARGWRRKTGASEIGLSQPNGTRATRSLDLGMTSLVC